MRVWVYTRTIHQKSKECTTTKAPVIKYIKRWSKAKENRHKRQRKIR